MASDRLINKIAGDDLSKQLKWKNLTNWVYQESKQEQWLKGELYNLVANDDHHLTYPAEIGWCLGPASLGDHHEIEQEYFQGYTERFWTVWKDHQGTSWLGSANQETQTWEQLIKLDFIPVEASKLHLCFNQEAYPVYTFELKAKIYLIEPPYTEGSLRLICAGERPRIFLDHKKDLLVFYHDDSKPRNTQLHYRSQSEAWEVEHTLPIETNGEKTLLTLQYFYEVHPDAMKAVVVWAVLRERSMGYLVTECLFPEKLKKLKTIKDTYQGKVNILDFLWVDMRLPKESSAESYQGYLGVSNFEWQKKVKEESYTGYNLVKGISWIKI